MALLKVRAVRKPRKIPSVSVGSAGRDDGFVPDDSSARRLFDTLKVQWEKDMEGVSNYALLTSHPAYLRIIGQGRAILPSILADLDAGGGPWFVALAAITGANPVKPKHRKNSSLMRQDWLQWGRTHGYHA
jgi:hypothetical protein